jgi:DNA-binding NarL/FixJ family response regulator
MSIKIIIADDHAIMRKGLRLLIEKQSDMEIIGEAENGRAAVQLANELKPDIVIMDVTMPDLNGIEAARQIVGKIDNVKVIALSMHSGREFVLDMLKAGVSGYILKESLPEELARAIHLVAANKNYLDPEIAGIAMDQHVKKTSSRPDGSVEAKLTDREREVLQLLAEGKTTKTIASQLYVSTKTIDTHRRQIMKKLNMHSLPELTKYAIRMGLTSLED